MPMARGGVQGSALHWMGHHGAQQRNRKEAVSQTPGTLPPDGCHHRRQVKRHGSFWTSPSCSGTLGRPTVQVEDPTPRLGQGFAVGYRIPCGSKLERVTFPETPPIPFPCWKGSDRASSRKGGNRHFPVAFRLKAGSPGPLVNMAQDNWHFFRLQCVGQPPPSFPVTSKAGQEPKFTRSHVLSAQFRYLIHPNHKITIHPSFPRAIYSLHLSKMVVGILGLLLQSRQCRLSATRQALARIQDSAGRG